MTNEKKNKNAYFQHIFVIFVYPQIWGVLHIFIEIILLYCNEIIFSQTLKYQFIFFEYTRFRRV
jgi:hypothetical protein